MAKIIIDTLRVVGDPEESGSHVATAAEAKRVAAVLRDWIDNEMQKSDAFIENAGLDLVDYRIWVNP